ncbi:Uncharacterized protein BM_BM18039 [Brugia malayi]|uniref:Uncharacterized protein n=1 Tax=Brugia malayi TaxID=6279 RepID=A0A4E9EZB7_BRUMA|nr:Uncharacterized protein BM_BM18039 [Brugia malayi]VIO89107.1 Uncharacterized protein BM_BM18039 [Brugia malayi]
MLLLSVNLKRRYRVSEKNIATHQCHSLSTPISILFLVDIFVAENYCANTFPGIYKLFGSARVKSSMFYDHLRTSFKG